MYIQVDGFEPYTKTYKVSFGNEVGAKDFHLTLTDIQVLAEYLKDMKECLPYSENPQLLYSVK